MTGWPVLAFLQAVPPTLVSPLTLEEGDWLDHSVEFWVEMELWKLSFCCKVIGRWNETLWMQLLQARKMMVNSSSQNQNHYKYVQLNVLFYSNKCVLQDFAKSFELKRSNPGSSLKKLKISFITFTITSYYHYYHTITKILEKFRFVNDRLNLHVYASCKFLVIGLLSIYSLMNTSMLFYFLFMF